MKTPLALLAAAAAALPAFSQLSITSLNQTGLVNFQSNVGHDRLTSGSAGGDPTAGDNVFKFGTGNSRTLIENQNSAWSATWSNDWGMSADAWSWSVSGQNLYSNGIGARTPFGNYNPGVNATFADNNSSSPIPNSGLINRGTPFSIGGRPVNHTATAGDWATFVGNNGAPFADYTLTLRVQNNTGTAVNRWTFALDTWYVDLDAQSATMAIGYSTNNTTFTTAASYLTTNTSVASTSYDAVAQTLSATFDATVAPGGFLYLQFTNTRSGGTGSGAGAIIDNWSVTAIPEPSAFAALAGLGALGFATSRRRRA